MNSSVAQPGVGLNVASIREDFPILQRMVNGKPLVYLDSTATSQKPEAVLQILDRFYRTSNANIHRGIYTIAEEATAEYEAARKKVQALIHAKSWREIVYTRNTTEALNLVAYTWGRQNVRPGDEILITGMEHHSNIVPWQLLAQEKQATLRFIPVTPEGRLDLSRLSDLLTTKTRIFAFASVSNVLGTINPTAELVRAAHAVGAIVVIDAAQAVPHMPVDVRALDCDFMAFSGHKMLGPTGIGVLYGKRALLDRMPPFMGGGDMIREVGLERSTWNELPYKFEAGTPAIAEAVGLGAAVEYLNVLGLDNIRAHERELTAYALDKLQTVPGIEILGPMNADDRGGVIAFNLPNIHPHDVAAVLDREAICVRAGHHCAMPLHEQFGLAATTRASFYVYNHAAEVDYLVEKLGRVLEVFGQ